MKDADAMKQHYEGRWTAAEQRASRLQEEINQWKEKRAVIAVFNKDVRSSANGRYLVEEFSCTVVGDFRLIRDDFRRQSSFPTSLNRYVSMFVDDITEKLTVFLRQQLSQYDR